MSPAITLHPLLQAALQPQCCEVSLRSPHQIQFRFRDGKVILADFAPEFSGDFNESELTFTLPFPENIHPLNELAFCAIENLGARDGLSWQINVDHATDQHFFTVKSTIPLRLGRSPDELDHFINSLITLYGHLAYAQEALESFAALDGQTQDKIIGQKMANFRVRTRADHHQQAAKTSIDHLNHLILRLETELRASAEKITNTHKWRIRLEGAQNHILISLEPGDLLAIYAPIMKFQMQDLGTALLLANAGNQNSKSGFFEILFYENMVGHLDFVKLSEHLSWERFTATIYSHREASDLFAELAMTAPAA